MTANDGKPEKMTRRAVLAGCALAGAALILGQCFPDGGREAHPLLAQDATPTQATYLPIVSKQPTPTPTYTPTATPTPTSTPTRQPGTGPKVVHVHDVDATYWGGSGYYGNCVRQNVVNAMVDRGVKELAGAATRADAWRILIPNYSGGIVAIKVNFNNSGQTNVIDGLIHPVNAVIQGLVDIGVATRDIWVFDAVRPIPDRFKNGCTFTGVTFHDQENASFPVAVTFSRPGIPAQSLASAVTSADYLINMPIVKRHSITGVTLGFKNHFGTISNCGTLHDYVDVNSGSHYSRTHNPMVDIYLDANIRSKTVLTLGDGLFGSKNDTNSVPQPWETFGNQFPNSLLFSTDPVAADCVMYDLLNAEPWYNPDQAADHLRLAADAGLGVYEQGDPWGSGYSQIDYHKITL